MVMDVRFLREKNTNRQISCHHDENHNTRKFNADAFNSFKRRFTTPRTSDNSKSPFELGNTRLRGVLRMMYIEINRCIDPGVVLFLSFPLVLP